MVEGAGTSPSVLPKAPEFHFTRKRGQEKSRTSQGEVRDLPGVQPLGSGDQIGILYKREP